MDKCLGLVGCGGGFYLFKFCWVHLVFILLQIQ